MSESPELLPVTEKKSSCGCHEHSDERLTLDARAIPHRLRHAAVIGAASSLNPGEGFDLVAPHVPTPLLAQIDQLPFTFQHTLLEQSEGFARVEILRTARSAPHRGRLAGGTRGPESPAPGSGPHRASLHATIALPICSTHDTSTARCRGRRLEQDPWDLHGPAHADDPVGAARATWTSRPVGGGPPRGGGAAGPG